MPSPFPAARQHHFLGAVATWLLLAPLPAQAQFLPLGPQDSAATTSPARAIGPAAAAAQIGAGAADSTAPLAPVEISPAAPRPESLSGRQLREEGTAEAERDRAIAAARPRLPSEFETYVSTVVDKPLRRFGSDLLVPGARDFTSPPTTTVPPDYRLNPGDEIVIGLAGSVQADDLRLVVDPEGRVFLPRAGAVTVAGVRYADLQDLLARQMSRFYRDFHLSVAVGRLHGITVYVTGFAATPGSYTVSSLSTLVNAVLAAGGPSAGGSFRSIQLRRGGQLVSDFDLYDLLLRGDKAGDFALQNGDVIYVAPVGAQVAVVGSVNREAIFEAAPGDSLADLLLYAGGANTVADDARLMVLNPLAGSTGGWEELTPAEANARKAGRSEIVRVLSAVGIARPLGQQPVLVTVGGEVARPGRYYFQPGTAMGDVIAKAGGLTGHAFPYATVVTRESVRQQQRLSFQRAIRDLELQLTTQPLVSINRADQMQPAYLQAVQSVIAQFRSREPDGRLVLDVSADATSLPGDLVLENNDTIYIPPQPVTVGVFGAVPSSASFRYAPGRTIGDYLKNAGGVSKMGDKSTIFVVRANGSVVTKRSGGGTVTGAPALPGDLVYVPIETGRGEFWARLRDITSTLFGGVAAAASIKVLAE
ncbi:SLBB domain-containing protein [Sphingomonas sp. DBB INV C78]|uniref:polysaccharide biosynthesis/export family protein n=1 Tax=Sphingomonas sp. DBB INV C78 TaxID=3349434 RepID=UPI0036D4130D